MPSQIQVQFSSYLARVAHRAAGPAGAGSAAGGPLSAQRLESLQDALARIDAFGAMAAEAIDEAQVPCAPHADEPAVESPYPMAGSRVLCPATLLPCRMQGSKCRPE